MNEHQTRNSDQDKESQSFNHSAEYNELVQ